MPNEKTNVYGTLIIGDLDAGGGNKIDLYYNSTTGIITESKTVTDGTVRIYQERIEYCDGFEYGPAVQKLLEEIRAGKNPKDEVVISKVGIADLMRELAPEGCPECGHQEFTVIAETSGDINTVTGAYETDGFDLVQVDCKACNHCLKE